MKFLFSLVIVLFFGKFIICDIPVHCVKSQIEGEWKFKATEPVTKSIEQLYDMTCGHPNPSHESSAYQMNMDLSLFEKEFSVKFGNNFVATINQNGKSRVRSN
jgi:hypothetical protein